MDYVGNRIPLIVAGSITDPSLAVKALDAGVSLVALGRALIINPDWVELVEDGQEDRLDSEVKSEKLDQLRIPSKLWRVIQTSNGWIPYSK
ncbi:NADH:flavin oxidoreductase / NADH oxidase family protein [compost metagenome]